MISVHAANLSPAQATAAAATHGMGLISNAIRCTVIERLNGDRSLRLEAPYTEHNHGLLAADRLVCAEGQFYRIIKPRRSDRRGQQTIHLEAQHVLYDLQQMPIENIETKEDPAYVDGITAAQALQQVLAGTPFTPGTVDIDPTKLDYLDILRMDRLACLTQIIDTWGGEIAADNWTIHLLNSSGANRGVQLRIGRNMDGLDVDEDIGPVVTRLHIVGHQDASIESVNDGKDYLDSPNIGLYAHVREGYATFEDEDDPAELLRLGQERLDEVDKVQLTARVDMLRIHQDAQPHYAELERVQVGDTVEVVHDKYGTLSVRVLEREAEVHADGSVTNTGLTLGNAQANQFFRGFKATARAAKATARQMDQLKNRNPGLLDGIINTAVTKILSSKTRRYTDEDGGEVYETEGGRRAVKLTGAGILCANEKDAQGKWRWRTAIDGDGVIADMVTTGVLNAALIKILGTNNFYWDADSICMIDPDDNRRQVRYGRYDGIHYGIGFTLDKGKTWQNAFGFNGVQTNLLRLGNVNLTEVTNAESQHFVEQAQHDPSNESGTEDNFPARFDFHVPRTTAKVVEVVLSFKLEPYRAYSKSAAAGGSETTEASLGEVTGMGGGFETGYQLPSGSNHTHMQTQHAHSMAEHTHEIENHEHEMVYGIYENPVLPDSITLKIDGVDRSSVVSGTTLDEYNIVALMEKSADGTVKRGWHSIEIYVPAGHMARVVAHLYSIVIIGASHTGGDLGRNLITADLLTMQDKTGKRLIATRA
jgi:phage minor structural protein